MEKSKFEDRPIPENFQHYVLQELEILTKVFSLVELAGFVASFLTTIIAAANIPDGDTAFMFAYLIPSLVAFISMSYSKRRKDQKLAEADGYSWDGIQKEYNYKELGAMNHAIVSWACGFFTVGLTHPDYGIVHSTIVFAVIITVLLKANRGFLLKYKQLVNENASVNLDRPSNSLEDILTEEDTPFEVENSDGYLEHHRES